MQDRIFPLLEPAVKAARVVSFNIRLRGRRNMPVARWVATRKQNLSSHVQVVPGQRWRGHLTQGRKVFVPVRIEQKNLGGNDMIDLKF